MRADRERRRNERDERRPEDERRGLRVILTVTLNAAIDRTVAVPNFRQGHRHRAVESRTVAGRQGHQRRPGAARCSAGR